MVSKESAIQFGFTHAFSRPLFTCEDIHDHRFGPEVQDAYMMMAAGQKNIRTHIKELMLIAAYEAYSHAVAASIVRSAS